MMATETRGSRLTFLSFCRPRAELKMTWSPSKSHQTGVTCGRPSGMRVARLAKARFWKRSLYFSGMACDMNSSKKLNRWEIIERGRDYAAVTLLLVGAGFVYNVRFHRKSQICCRVVSSAFYNFPAVQFLGGIHVASH